MMDVLGPRLSGSPGLRKSADWVVGKLKGWGIAKAGLEPWPTDPTGTNNGFPRGWANEKFYLHATIAQRLSDLGHVDRMDARHEGSGQRRMRSDRRHGGQRAARAILRQAARQVGAGTGAVDMRAQWDPVAQAAFAGRSRRCSKRRRGRAENGSPPARQLLRRRGPAGQQARSAATPSIYEQGALGVISTNKGHGTVNVTGGGRADGPDTLLPRIAIEAEHYGRIARSMMQGQPVTIEADIRNAWYDNPEMFNIVARNPRPRAAR